MRECHDQFGRKPVDLWTVGELRTGSGELEMVMTGIRHDEQWMFEVNRTTNGGIRTGSGGIDVVCGPIEG